MQAPAHRARFLSLLRARSILFPASSCAADALPLLITFLRGGGYTGAEYSSTRRAAQRALFAAMQSGQVAAQHSAKPGAYANGNGNIAAQEGAGRGPSGGGGLSLVPWGRRLSKKVGDLLQLLLILFDWQPDEGCCSSSPPTAAGLRATGISSFHGALDTAAFKYDLLAALQAFAQGLVFDSAPGLPRGAPAAAHRDGLSSRHPQMSEATVASTASSQAVNSATSSSPAVNGVSFGGATPTPASASSAAAGKGGSTRGASGSGGSRTGGDTGAAGRGIDASRLAHIPAGSADAVLCMRLIVAAASLYLCWSPPPAAAGWPPVPYEPPSSAGAAATRHDAHAYYASSVGLKLQAALRALCLAQDGEHSHSGGGGTGTPELHEAAEAQDEARTDQVAAAELDSYFESARVASGRDLLAFTHAVCRADRASSRT
jgi:hypothetical protein